MGEIDSDKIDWGLTTWEGARREQMRRWAALPLESIVAALEEMQEIADWLHPVRVEADAARTSSESRPAGKTA